MDLQSSLLRWEVLRQLCGTTLSWIPYIVFIVLTFKFLDYLYNLVVDKRVGEVYSAVTRALEVKQGGITWLGDSRLRGFCLLLMGLGIGSALGYYTNAYYVSGDISLIVTAGRVTAFYRLFLLMMESYLIGFYALIIFATSLRLRKVEKAVFTTGFFYKFTVFGLRFIRIVGILMAIFVSLASTILVYLALAR